MKLEVFVDAEKQATFEWADKWALSTQDATILSWWQKQNAAPSFFDGLAAIFSWESIGYDVLIVDWKDWEKFKDEFARRELSIIKSKIYLKPQEKPPKGLKVKRGPKGGLYYETKAKVAPKAEVLSQPRKEWISNTLEWVGDYNLKILERKGNTILGKMRYGDWTVKITFLEDAVQIGDKIYYYDENHNYLKLTPKAKKSITFLDALKIEQCNYDEEAKNAAIPILLNQKVELKSLTSDGIETKKVVSPLAFRFYENVVFKHGKYGEITDPYVEHALEKSRLIANIWYEAGQASGRSPPEKAAARIKRLIKKKDKRMMLSMELTKNWTEKYGAEKIFRGETSGAVQKEIQSLAQEAIKNGKDEIQLKTDFISSWTENEKIADYWKDYTGGATKTLLSLPKKEYTKHAIFNYQIHDSEYNEQEITLLPKEDLVIKISDILTAEYGEKLIPIREYLK